MSVYWKTNLVQLAARGSALQGMIDMAMTLGLVDPDADTTN